jgi:hypothetical protein
MAGQYAGEVTITKCEHGVYDPHGDQNYCDECNPKTIRAVVSEVKPTAIGKIGVFANKDEMQNQVRGVLGFVAVGAPPSYLKQADELLDETSRLPKNQQPEWFKQMFKNWVSGQSTSAQYSNIDGTPDVFDGFEEFVEELRDELGEDFVDGLEPEVLEEMFANEYD